MVEGARLEIVWAEMSRRFESFHLRQSEWALFLKEKVPTPKELELKLNQAKLGSIFDYNINTHLNNFSS